MGYVRVADHTINSGNFQEIADTVKADLLPKFQQQGGVHRYGLADMGEKTCVSMSYWTTREAALAAEAVAAAFAREHLVDKVVLQSSSVGDVPFLEGVPAIASSHQTHRPPRRTRAQRSRRELTHRCAPFLCAG